MNKSTVAMLFGLLLLASLSAKGQEPASADSDEFVKLGVQLYDKGEYSGAIEQFNKALKVEPGNVEALYERAMAYLASAQYPLCIEDVKSGLKANSHLQPDFFTLAGNCYSQQQKNDKALEYFNEGLKAFPRNEQLNFNIAITLSKMGREKEARTHLKDVLAMSHNRASANLYLAILFKAGGYRIPALFMFLRFLMVEPSSDRSQSAANDIIAILGQGFEKKSQKDVTITFNPDEPTDEGEYAPLSLFLSLSGATAMSRKDKDKTMADAYVSNITTIVQIADERNDPKLRSTFVWGQALEPLIKMKQAKVLEAFLYKTLALGKIDGSQVWIDRHAKDIDQLKEWMDGNLSKL